ncbi:MAG TPA: tetratricopeptide repeat protein [Candidatus Polarisedimenticolia bacterium]|nr:tetratricopeptide repeat protein [Candidatus Polarisedimenticolia bacterium]
MTGRCGIRPTSLCAQVFFFLLWLLPAAAAQSAEDGLGPIAFALQNREFQSALELLRPALQGSPNNVQLWAMQGAAYAGQGHTKEALASFRSALKISPDYLPALQGAIQIEYEADDPAAIPLLQRMLRLRPLDATSHGMLAVLEYQRGNCGAAVVHFEKARTLFNSQASALHAYAICLVKLKQPDKAASVFQRTLVLNPDDRRERRLLASVQLMAHQSQDALITLGPLLEGSNEEVETLELAATAYEENKDTPQAVATLRQAILLDPKNVNLYVDFANISSAHDSFQVGIGVVSDGIGQLPRAVPLYLARGVLYVQLAQYDRAEADFETAHTLDPRQSLSSAAQGLLAVQEDDVNRALATVQAKLVQRPKDAPLLYLQADFLSQKGVGPGTPEFQLAMHSAKEAVALQPTLSEARTVLAKLYLQEGKYAEAIEQCRKALERDPKNQIALYHLIQALRKAGDKREIPNLLKQLALLRKQAAREQSERNQYKLVEEDTQSR